MIKEWEKEPDHEEWIDKETGYKCEIKRHPEVKHLCGYVYLPESHPDYGKEYDDIDIVIHGDLTYGGSSDYIKGKFGFDCAHDGDLTPTILSVYPEAAQRNIYRNWDYVKNEVLNMAKQFKEREKGL
jgi:hypothetical protein